MLAELAPCPQLSWAWQGKTAVGTDGSAAKSRQCSSPQDSLQRKLRYWYRLYKPFAILCRYAESIWNKLGQVLSSTFILLYESKLQLQPCHKRCSNTRLGHLWAARPTCHSS